MTGHDKLKILKNSESCARRKKFNKFTECWLGFYKCATDQNPKIIESNYLDAISNCAQFVELSAITQVGVPPWPSPWDSLKILSIKSDSWDNTFWLSRSCDFFVFFWPVSDSFWVARKTKYVINERLNHNTLLKWDNLLKILSGRDGLYAITDNFSFSKEAWLGCKPRKNKIALHDKSLSITECFTPYVWQPIKVYWITFSAILDEDSKAGFHKRHLKYHLYFNIIMIWVMSWFENAPLIQPHSLP